jgi:ribonuclease HI
MGGFMTLPKVTIYADELCQSKVGKGGCGIVFYFQSPAHLERLYEFYPQTTNKRLKIQAAISALAFLTCPHDCVIYSSSQYLINGMAYWIKSWKKKGWTRGKGVAIENMDLWQQLDALAQKHTITWQQVEGHSGNEGKKHAVFLANLAIKTQSNASLAINGEILTVKHSTAKNSVFIVISEYTEKVMAFDSHKKASDFIEQTGDFSSYIKELEVR